MGRSNWVGLARTAFFVLEAAATGTGIIPPGLVKTLLPNLLDLGQSKHDIGRRTLRPELGSHVSHRLVDVIEKGAIARTQIIQPWLTVRGFQDTVLRTTTIAHKTDFTFPAVRGEHIAFVQAELPLLG